MMNTTCYRLVVCEKPSVARSIAAVLGAGRREDGFLSGGGYLVSWCFGHLAELSDADAYDEKYGKWRREDLPILPESWQYTVARDKQKQMNTLRTLMHREDVCEVVNACDAGREGELIFRTVYCLAGYSKPILRLWISSMEDAAILDGFDNDVCHPVAADGRVIKNLGGDLLIGMENALRQVLLNQSTVFW